MNEYFHLSRSKKKPEERISPSLFLLRTGTRIYKQVSDYALLKTGRLRGGGGGKGGRKRSRYTNTKRNGVQLRFPEGHLHQMESFNLLLKQIIFSRYNLGRKFNFRN